jgi:restriction system protein
MRGAKSYLLSQAWHLQLRKNSSFMDTHEDSNEGLGSANIVYHYPADLLQLLIDVIPLLCRSKRDVLTFFRSAGVRASFLDDLDKRLRREPEKLNKHEIARTVLTLLNEKGEPALRERREVLRRVVEWEDFSTCYADNRERAQYLVVQIQRLVGVKDAFTRMRMEREAEKKLRQAKFQAKQDEVQQRKAELAEIKADLYALFSHSNPQQRGKALEGVLNRLFKVSGFHVRDAFALSGFEGEGTVEQVDGMVEIDGEPYLVEMKWWKTLVGLRRRN